MKSKIKYIRFALIFSLLILLTNSCERKEDVVDSNTAITLQFQEYDAKSFYFPQEKFYEIKVDLEARKFSRPKKLDSFEKLKNPTCISEEIQEIVLNVLDANSEDVSISRVSPDKHWASGARFEKLTTADGNSVDSVTAYYLVDLIEPKLAREFSSIAVRYFTNDPNVFICSSYQSIKKMTFPSWETTEICPASSFFMLPGRNKLMVFNKHKIWLYDLDGNKEKRVGKYRRIVGGAGLVNKKWAIFFTGRNVKPYASDKIFFINLSTYDIIQYPYKFPPARIVRKIPEPCLEITDQ